MKSYSKVIAALAAGLGVAVALTVDGDLSLNDGLAIASAAVGALVVYAVPNKPPAP